MLYLLNMVMMKMKMQKIRLNLNHKVSLQIVSSLNFFWLVQTGHFFLTNKDFLSLSINKKKVSRSTPFIPEQIDW